MKNWVIGLATLAMAASAFAQSTGSKQSGPEDLSGFNSKEPPILGPHWSRGIHPAGQRKGANPNMTITVA